jgi:1-acyl-sn-glycerol-3-phosphate acyltransferase
MQFVSTLLAPLRLAVVLLHVLGGILVAAFIYPVLSRVGRNRITKLWSRNLLYIVGLRLVVTGEPIEPEVAATGISTNKVSGAAGRLLLANHSSWIDVFAMNAVVPTRFVAKAEIGSWPLLGTLVSLAGTLYVERGRRHAVHAINQKVAERLRLGETIGIYPEGTTTDGSTLLPFHANLVQPALDVGGEIRPVALRYMQGDAPSRAAAYIGEDTLVGSLWRIAAAPGLTVQITWLPQLTAVDNRHAAGRAARSAIAAALGIEVLSPESAPADTQAAAERDRASAAP